MFNKVRIKTVDVLENKKSEFLSSLSQKTINSQVMIEGGGARTTSCLQGFILNDVNNACGVGKL